MNYLGLLLLCLVQPSLSLLIVTPRSCLSSSGLVASTDRLLDFTTFYAQLDRGQTYPGQHADGFNYATRPELRDRDGSVLTGAGGGVLRIVAAGTTAAVSDEGYSNSTGFLSTIVLVSRRAASCRSAELTRPLSGFRGPHFPRQASSFLVPRVFLANQQHCSSNQSSLCSAIRTSAPTSTTGNGTTLITDSGCPYGPGEIAMGVSIPLRDSYALTTITAKLVVLNPSDPPFHLACYDLEITPYYPTYFAYPLIHYLPIGLLGTYLLIYLVARLWSAYTDFIHNHETQLASSLTLQLSSTTAVLSKRKMLGTIWFGAWAGRQVVGSGSLRRFVTAELKELFVAAVWWTLVGTVAVDWPGFACESRPFGRDSGGKLIICPTPQTLSSRRPPGRRSSTVSCNCEVAAVSLLDLTTPVADASLPFTSLAPPLLPSNFTAPPTFATQMADASSPLYLNASLSNILLDLENARPGIEKWAHAAGVRFEDLFSICAFTFFLLCAVVVASHIVFTVLDTLVDLVFPSRSAKSRIAKAKKGKEPSFLGKEQPGSHERTEGEQSTEEYLGEGEEYEQRRPEDDFPSWQLHLALLQGNLTRILLLFHLPLSIFSVYQIALHAVSPTSTLILAIFVLAVVCVAVPLIQLWRIHRLPVTNLYNSLPVLLSIGPLYNTYSDECCLFAGVRFTGNLIIAAVVGGAQGTGTAQAAVILLVEVADTLVTSLWLPWGDNAAMGPLAFVLSISRIIVAVLLVVLSPSVDVSDSAASWLAYVVFLVQALVAFLLLLVLAFKVVELGIRLVAGVPFDESRSPRVGGLFGALRRWDRGGQGTRGGGVGGGGRRREAPDRRRQNHRAGGHDQRLGTNGSESTVGTHTRMLPPRSGHHSRASSSMSMGYADVATPSAYGRSPYVPSTPKDDEGFIMSSWSPSNNGYVKPGAYSTSAYSTAGKTQPILRSGPAWGEPVVTPAEPSGFARIGGGKASSSNPYQLANAAGPTAYPPYPSSSADLYGSSMVPANPRRLSQSAVIEMASSSSDNPSRVPPRSSVLLSNTVAPYSIDQLSPVRPAKANHGFFGRFKRKGADEDLSSDDDDDSDDERPAKTRLWPLRFGRKVDRAEGEEEEREESPVEPAQKGFVVTRKARPAASVSTSSGSGQLATRVPLLETPHVSVEAPSRSASFEEDRGARAG